MNDKTYSKIIKFQLKVVSISYGLNCPSKLHMLKPQPLIPSNVTMFGDRVFKEIK